MKSDNTSIDAIIADLEREKARHASPSTEGASLPPPRKPPLNNGGMGGMSPDMEARVTKLEEHVGNIRVDVADIKANVSHLPDKDYMRKSLRDQLIGISVIVAIIGGIVGAAAHFIH